MNDKVLVDTNILIYAIDQDSQYHSKSRDLLLNLEADLFTTSKNLSEFLAVVTKGHTVSLSIDDALLAINDFLETITILYPDEISFSIFRELLQEYHPTGLRIHDFEIISIGLAHKIKQIATKNIQDFKNVKEISLINI